METDEPTDPETLKEQLLTLLNELRGPQGGRFIAGLVLLNIVFLFARPQASLPFLHTLQFPVFFSILGGLAWFSRFRSGWTTQTKAMAALLLLMAIWVPFARNNFWSFHTWRDVLQQFLCYFFPVVIFLSNGRDLVRLFKLCAVLGCYLALFAIFHKGVGPGAFLTDENDMCLALVMFFGLTAGLALDRRLAARWLYLGIAILIVVGVVATLSRGGFVGFILALAYLLWRSQHKVVTAFFGLCILLSALYFAPAQYWNEMSTIQQTDQGTAKQRRELWAIGMKVWLYPKNFIAGVGQANVPYHLGDFEPEENKSSSGKSVAGRAVHSMYVQLASELGLIGITIVLVTVISSYRGNNRLRRDLLALRAYLLEVQRATGSLRTKRSGDIYVALGNDPIANETNSVTYENLDYVAALAATKTDLFITILTALNASWLGVLAAATFISTLYYPPLWFLAALTASVQLYARRLYLAAGPFVRSSLRDSLNELARIERGH